MCRLSWFLDLGGWSKAAEVGLYFIFSGISTLSLEDSQSLAQCVAMDLCTCFCQLLDKDSVMAIKTGFLCVTLEPVLKLTL
ncbi:hypothetical protein STEG23_034861 [Scotinomys teguina]